MRFQNEPIGTENIPQYSKYFPEEHLNKIRFGEFKATAVFAGDGKLFGVYVTDLVDGWIRFVWFALTEPDVSTAQVKTDINLRINRAFAANNIEIPVFGDSHVAEEADKHGIVNYAKIPIEPQLPQYCDSGTLELFDQNWLDGVLHTIETCCPIV